MLKKIFISLLVAISAITATLPAVSQPAYADSDVFTGRSGADCGNFLGFVSWDCNVNIGKDQDSLKSGIWIIAANILTDITVVAAYLVLGFVIYGGYLYTMSGGDPGKVANGKKTLTHAFIGLAIVLLSNIILNSIRIALGGANLGTNCATSECVNPAIMISSTIQWVVGIAGMVSVIFIVYGGISYSSSAGDPAKVKKAKDMILYALIGLIIVGIAEIITAFVTNTINEAKESSSYQNITISKEVNETQSS